MSEATFRLTLLAAGLVFGVFADETLTDGWQFSRDGASWQSVRVPHDWAVSGPFDPSLKDGGTGKLPWRGKGRYRRALVLSDVEARTLSEGGFAYLHFDGVMASPQVTVNGRDAGGWDYGYMSFSLDVTKFLQEGTNWVDVSVDTTHHDSRWYPGAGIYRKVVFAVRPHEHVLPGTLAVATPEVSTNRAVVTVSYATPAGPTNYSFTVERPRLWDVENPSLYDLEILGERVKYGIRTARFTADDGFHLNGRRVQLKGVNLHSDLGLLGMAFDRSAMRRQLRLMKEMGANAVRTSHNVPSPELLELCDEMGLLVWDECFDKWDATSGRRPDQNLEDYIERNLRQFVRRDRNHPCVIVWSIANEIWEWDPAHPIRDTENRWADRGPEGQTKERNVRFCRAVREEDPMRPVANGNRPYLNEKRVMDLGIFEPFDVLGFNYLRSYVEVHKRFPDKPLVYSESASAVSSYGFYRENPLDGNDSWQARDTPPFQVDSRDLQSNIGVVDEEFDYMERDRYCAGEFVWTGIDYLGEPSPHDKNARSSYYGIVGLDGVPKDRYWLYRSHWRPTAETLHISPDSWTFPGWEGKNVPVMVYTDSEEAELFVNGRSQGRRRKGVPVDFPPNLQTNEHYSACHKYRLMWLEVPYEPGELKVIAYRNGKETGSRRLQTAGRPTELRLTVEPSEGLDAEELVWAHVSAFDAVGVRVPNATNRVSIAVSGPGEILGVGNADPRDYVSFTDFEGHRLFGGNLTCVIRRTGTGPIIVSASTDGLRGATQRVGGSADMTLEEGFRHPPMSARPQTWKHWSKEDELVPSGILGPISLQIVARDANDGNKRLEKTSSAPIFANGEPVWHAGHATEMNEQLAFRGSFKWKGGRKPVLRLASSNPFRVKLNGTFAWYGPARGPKGFFRCDEIPLAAKLGENLLEIECAGYNCATFYFQKQPSFLQAEVEDAGKIILRTSGKRKEGTFTAHATERVRKVSRYSHARPFGEAYVLPKATDRSLPLEKMPDVALLPRRVSAPSCTVMDDFSPVAGGACIYDTACEVPKAGFVENAGQSCMDGYPKAELTYDLWAAEHRFKPVEGGPVPAASDSYDLSGGQYIRFDSPRNRTGFPVLSVACLEPGELHVVFDEHPVEGVFKPWRSVVANDIVWKFEKPGVYEVEAFEPYVLKVLQVVARSGAFRISSPRLRLYRNSDSCRASFRSSDPELDALFAAAEETFAQNAVDGFMDCPGRERAGWNCDAYFTSRASSLLTGNLAQETLFLENFARAKSFDDIDRGMIPMCYPSDHPNGLYIPSWAMFFVLQLDEYARLRDGDRTLVESLRPRVFALVDFLLRFRNSDGLLENLPGWVFVEWSKANEFVKGVNYPNNMIWAATLEAVDRLYGRPDLAAEAKSVKDVVRRQSWTGKWFCDNAVRQKDGSLRLSGSCSETCQYHAFYFGLATCETHPELYRQLISDFGPARDVTKTWPDVFPSAPFIGNFMRLDWLGREGLVNRELVELKRYFAGMAQRTATLWENSDCADGGSCCHGFASHVAVFLIRDIVGLKHIDARGEKVDLVPPKDLPLDFCELQLPFKGRTIRLGWRKTSGGVEKNATFL